MYFVDKTLLFDGFQVKYEELNTLHRLLHIKHVNKYKMSHYLIKVLLS